MAYITLHKNNFFNNLDIIAKKTKSKDKIALVLKDNAYGHGLLEISQMAQEYGVKKAVVQTCAEAQKIENKFEYILVLADFPTCKNDKIRYTINDVNAIQKFPKGTKVELKVDTGMHRNGVSIGEVGSAIKIIEEQGLILEAVFTHHRSADSLTSEWFWQNENFTQVKAQVKSLGYGEVRFHSCNSAALFRHVDFGEDMARVGIAAYGCLEMPNAYKLNELKPVLSVHATQISSRTLHSGEALGYGATFRAGEDCRVSNYDFGYGAGFLRTCSNNYTSPKGFKLVGRVSMDNSSFVSDAKEILIFDDARVAAKFAKTIAYEVLTSLKVDLRRNIL